MFLLISFENFYWIIKLNYCPLNFKTKGPKNQFLKEWESLQRHWTCQRCSSPVSKQTLHPHWKVRKLWDNLRRAVINVQLRRSYVTKNHAESVLSINTNSSSTNTGLPNSMLSVPSTSTMVATVMLFFWSSVNKFQSRKCLKVFLNISRWRHSLLLPLPKD